MAGAWRSDPPALSATEEELEELRPLLHKGAVNYLLWWKARRSSLAGSPLVSELHQAACLVALQYVEHDEAICRVFQCLREHGIEPMLVKGWAVARHYPDPALHPPGDIDLIVRPEQRPRAMELLRELGLTVPVDLEHEDMARMVERGWDAMYERSELVPLNGISVRVMGPEDHLAFLCLHCLHHACGRALWLCDIAAALEARPAGFNWERCLGRRAEPILAAIRLAHALLGARVDDTPAAGASPVPDWLVSAVLEEWQAPAFYEWINRDRILDALRHPTTLPRALLVRWPGPIEASVRTGAPFNDLPRFPFQVASFSILTARLFLRLPRLLRRPV